uniref:Uncharacterized protein n=1 Tax=Grammatophora oceanica TaxID=210454 RepID=A0A7S1Y8Q9_9STRA|mmetsp:Transcript_31582/g.46844  ORF Transcript_31582/g.46844 Transcript_31582/m.46844 type:complete len:126 (+) Transcript_31582:187-564(+)
MKGAKVGSDDSTSPPSVTQNTMASTKWFARASGAAAFDTVGSGSSSLSSLKGSPSAARIPPIRISEAASSDEESSPTTSRLTSSKRPPAPTPDHPLNRPVVTREYSSSSPFRPIRQQQQQADNPR